MRRAPRNMPLLERIMRRVKKDVKTGCWIFTGGKRGTGKYGSINWRKDGKLFRVYTHRLIYETFKGKIPSHLEIDHLCRVHACCNPDHLEAVTRSQNILRGRLPLITSLRHRRITHCPKGHPYSGSNLGIRITQNSRRRCRACNNECTQLGRARKQLSLVRVSL